MDRNCMEGGGKRVPVDGARQLDVYSTAVDRQHVGLVCAGMKKKEKQLDKNAKKSARMIKLEQATTRHSATA